jgi:phosphatidylserine decarboxylase
LVEMSIHKEGYKIIAFVFLILAIMNIVAAFKWPDNNLLKWVLLAASFLFLLFIVMFFRRPDREMEPDPLLVYAPADGRIVVIEETFEKEYFKDTRLQVSIFMSPFNVHVNRYPVSGKVKYVRYHPGKKIVAWHPKSSELNERSTVVVEAENGTEIMVRQIAGAVARRIVTYSHKGDIVKQGNELGFIKFGSRVDLFLPLGTEIEAPLQQQVRANRSVIANIL